MIEKARQNHSLNYSDPNYQIDSFRNPYISRLGVKLGIDPISQNFGLISPFSVTAVSLNQSLPLFSGHDRRLVLLWKNQINSHDYINLLGLAACFKIYQNTRIKTKMYFGDGFAFEAEASRVWRGMQQNQKSRQIFAKYANRKGEDQKVLRQEGGIGFRWKNYEFSAKQKYSIKQNPNLFLSVPLSKNITFQASIFSDNQMPNIRILSNLNENWETALGLKISNQRANTGLSIEIEKKTQKYGKLLLYSQFQDNGSIVYAGYKSPAFQLVLPVFFTNDLYPTVLLGIAVLAGYLLRGKKVKDPLATNSKSQQDMLKEVKLISDKAAQVYHHQKTRNGLVVLEAYIGPKPKIQKLIAREDRPLAILRDSQYKNIVFDITVSLRFYTLKSEVKLVKGDKIHLLGVYFLSSDDYIYVLYEKEGNIKQTLLPQTDYLHLK